MPDFNARAISTEIIGLLAESGKIADKKQCANLLHERIAALQAAYHHASARAVDFERFTAAEPLSAAEYMAIQDALAGCGVTDAANRFNAHLARHLRGVARSQIDREFAEVAGQPA